MQSSTLEFQSFNMDSSEKEDGSTLIDVKTSSPPLHREDRDEGSPSRTISKSFCSFEYYQQFFDVNTDDVKSRLIWAMLPRPGRNYLEHCIKPYPDLYGPFWICTTLVFTIAVSGNVANYLQYAQDGKYYWKYDFHLISTAAVVIFSYTCFVPIAVWTFMKWSNSQNPTTFLELLCVYGYSLAIYIPVSILWVIQYKWFQWGLVMFGASLSAIVLISSVAPSISGGKKIPALAIMIALHFLLAVGFMEYFFHVPVVTPIPSLPAQPPNVVHPTSAVNATHAKS